MSGEANLQFKLETGAWMQIQPLAPQTIRVRVSPSGRFADPALVRYGILRHPEPRCEFRSGRSGHLIRIQTGEAELRVDSRNGMFCLFSADGSERIGTAAPPVCGPDAGFSVSFGLQAEEALYGLGDAVVERLNKRGGRAVISCERGSPFVPISYVMSSRGWALTLATTYTHTLDLGAARSDRLEIASRNGEFDLYLFSGNGFGELLNRYTDIAGKPALMPIWAYGLSFIGNPHIDSLEVVNEALKFRQAGIPCDLIVLNNGWTRLPDDGSANHQWNPKRFPMPSRPSNAPMTFIDMLRRHGFKLSVMMSCDADLTLGEAERGDAVCPERTNGRAAVPARPDEADDPSWYSHLRPLVSSGVAAFYITGTNQLDRHPDRRAANGMTDDEMHNLYPVLLAKQMFDGFREQTGLRPFIVHSMAGYTGIQQFAATPSGRFGNKEEGLAAVLGYGLSGHSHSTINMDLSTREGIHAGFLQTWVQVNNWSQVWHPGMLEASLLELFRTYAHLRYRLLPYLYATAHVAARTGLPVVRAMPLVFADDPMCRDLPNEYMLGDFLLVAVFTSRVYLPDGVWIDYWTGQRYEGRQTIDYIVPEKAGGPLFVRAGAILPFGPNTDYISPHRAEALELRLYPHERSEWVLFEDDGTSFAYAEGKVAATRIRCETNAERTIVHIAKRSGAYDGMPAARGCELTLQLENKPSAVRVNGKPLTMLKHRGRTLSAADWQYDRRSKTVRLLVEEQADASDLRVEIVHSAYAVRNAKSVQAQADAAASGSGDEAAERSAIRAGAALRLALDSGDAAAVERELEAWWQAVMEIAAASPRQWRLQWMSGALLAVHHAERRGWPLEDVFGDELDMLLQPRDILSPEQGLALLARLFRRLDRYAGERAGPLPHPAVREAIALIERDLARTMSLRETAERVGAHPSHLSRLFHQATGQTFTDYRQRLRMEQAKQLLEAGSKVHEASRLTGFKDVAHFSRAFTQYWGKPPVQFKGRQGPL
ncbi:MAG: xylS [Paenibacillus sp.]|nr:xylS [Paenibacillus sp.]